MKGKEGKTEDFRVPLCAEALAIIEAAKPMARDGLLFPSARAGVVSDMAMGMHMRRKGLEARPHGFRTSLRTWLAEATSAPHEVAETMLGHKVDSAVTRAYRRTDYLEERRRLHEAWASYLTSEKAEAGNIVRLTERA
jgi:integrase